MPLNIDLNELQSEHIHETTTKVMNIPEGYFMLPSSHSPSFLPKGKHYLNF